MRGDEHRTRLLADCLGAVDHQVHDNLLDLPHIGLDKRQTGIKLQPELHVGRDGGLDQVADFLHQLGKVDQGGNEASLTGVGQ